MKTLAVYTLGQGGVNLSKDSLQLANDELTQAQNAEINEDSNTGGDGALSKRGGLAALTTALAGSILGIHSFPILTTYTRTLYVGKGTAASNTFKTTTDGSTFTNLTTPNAPVSPAKFVNENNARSARRAATWKNLIFYAGNNYTSGSTNPEIEVWDGTTAQLVTRINIGPSGNGSPPYAITDMLAANGKVYIGVHDPGGTGANIAGRVLALDPATGLLTQVLNPFGPSTGQMTGGCPSALCWYQGQLWVGLNGSATTNGIGKLVRAYPDVDTSWTSEKADFVSHISSIASFLGDLYVGTQSSATTGAKLMKRASATGTWTTQLTSASGAAGNGHYAALYVYSSQIWAVEYFKNVNVINIITSTDGTTFTTSRDVVANDSPDATNPQLPGNALDYGGDLFYAFRPVADSGTTTDGFVMRRSGVTWTKTLTDNTNGHLITLVTRA